MVNYNNYLLRYHNEYYTLNNEERSLYKANHYEELRKGLITTIRSSSIKTHPFESTIIEGCNQDIDDIDNFLLSIGNDNVIVNSDRNAMLFKNILDYDMYNYEVNYQKKYIFDLPWTNIKTVNKIIQNYKCCSPIYYLIDNIFKEIVEEQLTDKSEVQIMEVLENYIPIMYNDVLLKGQLINKAFIIKEYINDEVVNTIIVPNENIAQKINFYQFNEFIKKETTSDIKEFLELKNFHKKEFLKYLNKKNNNVVLFKRK